MEGTRLKNCQPFFGHSGRHQIERRARHPSPLSMGLKRCSPRNSHTDLLESMLLMKRVKNREGMTMSRSWRRTVPGLLCVLHITSKLCVATIAAKFAPGGLRKATLFFAGFNPRRGQTS